MKTETNVIIEIKFRAAKSHVNPFADVSLDVVVTDPVGTSRAVPAFWAGGDEWRVRYASSLPGMHTYRSVCSVVDDTGLHGVTGKIEIVPYRGENPLYRHGPIRIAGDKRHFEHADGTPFLWLADTWWKDLAKHI
ncbi:DUF5060 domain-containing protein [bacterium]|nr:MAG: DUF5060 domain-containing protein [bacterium]